MESHKEVLIGKLTRREFREAVSAGRLDSAIVALGATEQHLDHLAMDHDIAMATHIATYAAQQLYPRAVVAVPTCLGLSEHHMEHPGSMTAKPGSWFSVVFDTIDSLVRSGLTHILLLNGHAGNEAPVEGILRQWQLYYRHTAPLVNLQFESYWNLCREFSEDHCEAPVPGHAQEYETSTVLHALPGNVRSDLLLEEGEPVASRSTAKIGRPMVEQAIERTAAHLRAMQEGVVRDLAPLVSTRERYLARRQRAPIQSPLPDATGPSA
ncbi:creatininase family protein [Ottowia thiooxydans]|uniref:Creatinine amidohydrolase n=1 Tax=Ottowia thiooxydans TaxID=219182 RepID=A0ABV2Q988_9BURK